MASVRSLGLHEPSALSYLIAESHLPADPPNGSYKWHHQISQRGEDSYTTEEILTTSRCVVWSINGAIKRVFNLDIEGEPLLQAFTTRFGLESSEQHDDVEVIDDTHSALVVILKTQAHVFLLSGDVHVLPLSFEVRKAFPCPRGFILQRQTQQDAGTGSFNPGISNHSSAGLPQIPAREALSGTSRVSTDSKLPYTFSFTELLSEIGVVVSGSARKNEPLESCHALSSDEEIIYVSTENELRDAFISQATPVYLAVTINRVNATMTLWQMVLNQTDLNPKKPKKQARLTGPVRRKSSNIYDRQASATTPVTRMPNTFRESFGGAGQSLTENLPFQTSREQISKHADELAAQLGHEFEYAGVQTRSARRVSSMLARTDLGGANDRTTFNDLNLGLTGRKSLRRSIRYGESLGGFSDRQSFGRRRSSFQATSSMISDGTSFLDQPAINLLDDNLGLEGPALEGDIFEQDASRQPREVGFMKLKSIQYPIADHNLPLESSIKILMLLAPEKSTADERRSRILSVCAMNRATREMTIVDVAVKPQLTHTKTAANIYDHQLKAIEIHRGQAIVDACKISDGFSQRLLTLTRTRDGLSLLHLEAPWSPSYRLVLPTQYKVFQRQTHDQLDSPSKRRNTGIGRIIPASNVTITSFSTQGTHDEVLLVDQEQQRHKLQVRLMPSNDMVRKVLRLANFILPPEQNDSLLVAWWEIKQWLEAQGPELDIEWTSLVIALFALAVPFMSKVQDGGMVGPRRKKGGMLRSSSGTSIDLEHWENMNEIEGTSTRGSWAESSAWSWTGTGEGLPLATSNSPKHRRQVSEDGGDVSKKNPFLVRCTNLARDFLQSPAGEVAMGPEGYLPTAVNKERNTRRSALASLLISIHLVREEQKLDNTNSTFTPKRSTDIAIVIVQIALWLKWPSWQISPGSYYASEIATPDRWLMTSSTIDLLDTPPQPFEPPSIFVQIESSIMSGRPSVFPSLLDLVSQSRNINTTHPLWKTAVTLTPRLFAFSAFLPQLRGRLQHRRILESMVDCGIDERQRLSIPDGIAAVFLQAITAIRANPPVSWPTSLRTLIGREDLGTAREVLDTKRGLANTYPFHGAIRDYHVISMSAIETESISRWDVASELDRQTVTKLIFRDDRRFQEASKLVNQTRPPIVECDIEPDWSEGDLLEAQKELAQHVSKRTLSVAAGRGIMHFNSRTPLLTERVPIPAFTPQCVIKPRNSTDSMQPMTFSADKALFTEEKTCWAFFHNGASAGLMISRDAYWIDTSWILYNKPAELTNRHAGFLLALGLSGHLKSLAKWVAFKYLTPKHTMTSVGLLIGLAASYLGTADTLITRLMSVHVTRLLPPGAAELNLSPLTQTAGLVGIGLLYHNSQHRRMSEIMLSEIENNDSEERAGDEPILRDEGYRLAAGFSLGLINLGHGGKLHSLHDLSIIERLLTVAIGTKNVNMVHVLDRATAGAVVAVAFMFMKTNDRALAAKIDIPDTIHQFGYVRPDVFLLRTLARHLIMWDHIRPSQDFIRQSLPLFYAQRADLTTTRRLSTDDLPFFNIIAGICFAVSLRYAGSHSVDARDLLIGYLDQFRRLSKLPAPNYDSKVTLNSVRNCLDVLALSCATVMAGSGDLIVMRRLRALHGRADPETPFGSHLAAHMALGTLFLSGGTATFGTSNLAIASLVMAFYPIFPTDVLDNRGHLQALRHLWVLAVENRCLLTRDVETGQIVSGIAAEIHFINGTKTEIQTPSLLPDLDDIQRIIFEHEKYWPVDLDLSTLCDVEAKSASGPAFSSTRNSKLGPLREVIKSDPKRLTIPLLRRSAHEKTDLPTFTSELHALDTSRNIPSIDPNATVNEHWKNLHSGGDQQVLQPFEWVFNLPAFRSLDHTERSLVLGDPATTTTNIENSKKLLSPTVVDTRLELEMDTIGLDRDMLLEGTTAPSDTNHHSGGSSNNDASANQKNNQQPTTRKFLKDRTMDKDKLWQLRLLFAWTDRWEKELGEETQRRRQRVATQTNKSRQQQQPAIPSGQPEKSELKVKKVRGGQKQTTDLAAGATGTTSHNTDEIDNNDTGTNDQSLQKPNDPQWMKREVIDRLRWRVWKMAGGTDIEDDDDEDEND